MTKQIVKINQGITFSGNIFWIGIMVTILALVLLILNVYWAIPCIILFISIQLILSIKTIEIDKKNNIFRFVLNVFPFKIGKWELISDYKKIVLAPDHFATKLVSPGNPFYQKNSNIRNYDVYLENELGKGKNLVLYSAKSIKEGQKVLKEYAEKFNIESQDKIKETWQKYSMKRKHKRSKVLT